MTEQQCLLKNEESSDLSDTDSYKASPLSTSDVSKHWRIYTCLTIFAVTSIFLNVVLFLRLGKSGAALSIPVKEPSSKYAKLSYDTEVPIYASTQYGPLIGTPEDRDILWDQLDVNEGVIALADEYADSVGLPYSQRFPWNQTQGVYLLGAFHQMHCLRLIQKYTSAAHHGRPQTQPYHHVEHCLDSMLQDTYCHADDTPWYQLPPMPERKKYAKYQIRQCKNWDRFIEWARVRNACYKFDIPNKNGTQYEDGNPSSDEAIQHFRYCSNTSPYRERMETFFQSRKHG